MPGLKKVPVIVALLTLLLAAMPIIAAQAGCTIQVINQTGYDMDPPKLVQKTAKNKKMVGQAPISNGKNKTFTISRGGKYRPYGLLTKDGEKIRQGQSLYSAGWRFLQFNLAEGGIFGKG